VALYTPIAKQYGAMSIVKWRDTNDDDADDDNVRPPYSLGVISGSCCHAVSNKRNNKHFTFE